MNKTNQLCVKLIHCGNKNIANPDDREEKSNFYIPMGVFPMANHLKKNGFDVEIINLDLDDYNIEEILDCRILDAVGLDCHWVNQSLVVLDTAELIKKMKPEVFVFLGGYTASFFSEEILAKYPAIDAIIRGDGEIPIVELCNVLKEKKLNMNRKNREHSSAFLSAVSFENVQNLVWRGPDNEIISNKFLYVATSKDMDQLNFVGVDLLKDWSFYRELCKFWTNFEPLNQFPVFFLEIGRGCTYNCSFCGGNSKAQMCISNRKGQAVRSIDSVIATIKRVVFYGYSGIFTTFEFEGSDQYYSKLYRRMKEEKIKINIGYGCWGIPSKLLIDEMSQCADHAIIEISPETADLDLRKKNKDIRLFYSNADIEECLDYITTRPNLKVQLHFGYFLAFDTEESIFNTMNYITKLFLKYSSFVEIFYSNLSTDPSSLLYLNPEKYNVEIYVRYFSDYVEKIRENYILNKSSSVNMTLFRPADMTAKEADHLAKKIELFKQILSLFGHSISLILSKAGESNIILDRLREMDLSRMSVSEFTADMIKNLVLDICNKNHIQNLEITRTINREYENESYYTIKSRKINRIEMKEVEVLTQEEKNRINSNIQKTKVKISADFDI